MADTQVQYHDVEGWIRTEWMPGRYGQSFERRDVTLTPGGKHNFAAVSSDGRIIAKISTGTATTEGGKFASGKAMKIRADMLFLTMVDADKKLVILTQQDMYDWCLRESSAGRVPLDIEFAKATIPPDLQERLDAARRASSREVTPRSTQ